MKRLPPEMATRPVRSRRRAAVLAEVMIALALLIPVIVIVAGLFPYSFSVDRKAWNQRTAQSLARSALEQARGMDFDDLDASFIPRLRNHDGSASTDGNVTINTQGYGQESFTVFRVRMVVTPDPIPTEAREKNVICEVTWARNNAQEKFSLESKVAKLYQGEP